MRLFLLLLVLASAGCSADARVDVRRYQLTGVVVGREASPARVIVSHEPVPGLMPAMSMAFDISSGAPPVRDGDRIVATLVVSDSKSWLEDVKVTARDGAAPRVTSSNRAAPGTIVPALPLLDQNGAPVTLPNVGGRVAVVTFIYTRCPLPDFCPLMVKHLETVRRRANEEGLGNRLALVGVTLDPAFDTPVVLHAYGESMLRGPDRFDQWILATGTPPQVEDVARFFGVGYRADAGLVVHTLTTAVVGHDGRVMRIFESNSWRPDDVLDVVRRGIEQAAVQ